MRNLLLSVSVIFLSACAATPTLQTQEASGVFTMSSAKLDAATPLTRIAFGSCLKEQDDLSIWNTIAGKNPDLFVFLGDNVYGDHYPKNPEFNDPDMPKMVRSYTTLAESPIFSDFRAQVPMMVTWDDHDFGANDGGADYPFREKAESLFLDAWDIPETDIRHSRPGIYTSETVGPDGQQVQIVLLDTRYFRGPLTKTDDYNAKGKERYVPSKSSTSTMLGETQWAWLADELTKPADLRIIVSSIQVIADGHGWEAWKMLPHEREKLYDVIDGAGVDNAIIVSGDRHAGAFYRRDDVVNYPLYEMTTSSLNAPVSAWIKPGDDYMEPGPHRLTSMQQEVNYGLIDIDWSTNELTMRLVSPGQETWTQKVSF